MEENEIREQKDKEQIHNKQTDKRQTGIDRADRDRTDRDQANRDQAGSDRTYRDRANRDQADRDKANRDQADIETLDITEILDDKDIPDEEAPEEQPSAPGRMRSAFDFICGFVKRFFDKKITVYAASAAFYLFLAFPPFIILVSLLIPRIGISVNELIELVTEVTPDNIDAQVEWIIRDTYYRAGSILPWTIMLVLWASANGVAMLSAGIHKAYSVKRKRSFLILRLISMAYIFSLILLLFVYTVLSTFAMKIIQMLGLNRIVIPESLLVVLSLRTWFFLMIGFVMVLLLYMFLSGRKISIRYHVVGTLFTLVAWIIFSIGFSAVIRVGINSNVIYGSLSVFVAMLMWIYFSVCILLAGGVLNQYIHDEEAKG